MSISVFPLAISLKPVSHDAFQPCLAGLKKTQSFSKAIDSGTSAVEVNLQEPLLPASAAGVPLTLFSDLDGDDQIRSTW